MKLANAGQVADAMRLCGGVRMNIMISGGTSTGQKTFARFLVSLEDPDDRFLAKKPQRWATGSIR